MGILHGVTGKIRARNTAGECAPMRTTEAGRVIERVMPGEDEQPCLADRWGSSDCFACGVAAPATVSYGQDFLLGRDNAQRADPFADIPFSAYRGQISHKWAGHMGLVRDSVADRDNAVTDARSTADARAGSAV